MESLLESIRHQIEAAKTTNAPPSELGDLAKRQTKWAQALEDLISDQLPQETAVESDALTEKGIIDEFVQVKHFKKAELEARAAEIHRRLRRWEIDTKSELKLLVSDEEIQTIIRDVYVKELKRSVSEPFDPDALAVWGGMFLRQGKTERVKQHFERSVRQSREYQEKHPQPPS